ncbi:hypothetical protein PisoF_04048 [Pseudomonas sp. IsoF]|uniref:hypothetical protein n=1 Tax=Pseudomonas sp. IsoF TaxID=2821559 RepID=UPI002064904B|nr:hypothetical protein [Pseudomonas sp. IsoF]UPL08342.1 hypothetical protein PisoF_04048 [Pseudomonas sp. IsoF]
MSRKRRTTRFDLFGLALLSAGSALLRCCRLLGLSTIAGVKIGKQPWVIFQSAGWVNFQSAPTAYWSIRHPDLYRWFAHTYPHEKPAFLFSREIDHSLCVSLGVHLALQADRDVLLRELESLRRTHSALCEQESPELDDPTKAQKPKSTSGVLSENAALLLYVIVGALLALMLGKTEKGLPRSIFDDQAAIVDAMTTLFPGVRGLKKRTLDRKFAEARRRFAQAGRE